VKSFKKMALAVLLGILSWTLSPATGKADFLPAFTGNTRMSEVVDGDVSFAVFAADPSTPWLAQVNTALGTTLTDVLVPGSLPVPVDTRFVYMYQVVNLGASLHIDHFKVPGASYYTSAGYFLAGTPAVFKDPSGTDGGAKVEGGGTGTGNPALGTNPSTDAEPDVSPNVTGVVMGGTGGSIVAGDTGTLNPNNTDQGIGGDGGGNVTIDFTALSAIVPNTWSSVFFLTSDVNPSYGLGQISDGSGPSDGMVPIAAPEPSSLTFLGMGFIAIAIAGWRRRQVLLTHS
jgi:hypothetical protein